MGLAVRLRGGLPPFTWLANDAPVAVGARNRSMVLPVAGPGVVSLTAIDRNGRAVSAQVRLR